MSIERARVDDGPAILRLISTSGLPVDGLVDHLDTALVARAEGRVIGSAVLEIYADGALLRSVSVDAAARGRGIGEQLTRSALQLASTLAVQSVYLLTTTAAGFFGKFDFERILRHNVPPSVQASIEFQSACPMTATVMRRIGSMALR